MKRPFAVTLLAIIAVIAGIIAVLDVLRYLGVMPFIIPFMGNEVTFYASNIFGAVMAGIVAAIWFWAAGKLWNLDPQGWSFVVVIAIIYLIFDVIAMFGGTSINDMWLSVGASVLALILGFLPGTRAAFGQK